MSRPNVILVTTSSCHLCEEAMRALKDLASGGMLTYRVVDASVPEGWALVNHHRPALLPFVLLDGELFSVGRLPRKKLRSTLERLPVAR